MSEGWVYILETDARPGFCKIGATRAQGHDRMIQVITDIIVADGLGYTPVKSCHKKFAAWDPFVVEDCVHYALRPWQNSEMSESFAIPFSLGCELLEVATSQYEPGDNPFVHMRKVAGKCGEFMGRDVNIQQIMAEIGSVPGRLGRSKLYLWMIDNFDQFSSELEKTMPRWEALAAAFTQFGLTARDGKVVSAETARKTWYRVRLDHDWFKAAEEAKAAAGEMPAIPKRFARKEPATRKYEPRIPPSLVIPDPPVMPPDVRMIDATTPPAEASTASVQVASDKVKEALRMLSQENSWLPRRGD